MEELALPLPSGHPTPTPVVLPRPLVTLLTFQGHSPAHRPGRKWR